MTNISASDVKTLRERTQAGMMDCKKALTESGGDMEKAVEWLRKKGLSQVEKKAGRVAAEGMVASYIHMGGKIGVLVEVNCESDFVARGEDFQGFVKDVAMQVCAAVPQYLKREDVPPEVIAKEREVYKAQVMEQGKPAAVADKIVEGKLNKWYSDVCLLEQPWVKEQKMTIEELRAQIVQKTGENVTIRRFMRWVLGEGIEKKKDDLAAEVAKMNAAAAAQGNA
jgi:elongation factor Ts